MTQELVAPRADAERSQVAYARLAGLMYLLVLAAYLTGLAISTMVVGSGTFDERTERIIASEALYRLALVLSLGGAMLTVPLAIGLYVAVRPIDGNLALMALLFRIGESAIGAVGIAISFAVLQMSLAVPDATALDTDQLGVLASLLSATASGEVAAIFFGVASTIFFYLFLRSTYIPKALSAWGLFASVLFLALWVAQLILPESSWLIVYASVPALIAELSTGFWLLIKGIKTQPAS